VHGETLIWVDGLPATSLPLPDRGLEFGDGLFETLLLHHGKPLYPELHCERLARGCQVLGFPDCRAAFERQLAVCATAVAHRSWARTALRITLTRGEGPRGYAPPQAATPRWVMRASQLQCEDRGLPVPAALGLAAMRWPAQPTLAGLKHLNRLEQVLAAAEYRRAGLDEAIMLDQQGGVVSVVAGNLFLVSGDRLLTPRIDQCGIAGTRRRLVMERWAPALGMAVDEGVVSRQQLAQADEVFFCNSLTGLRPVASFQGRNWSAFPLCTALHQQYRSETG
jgi:4-amino-4-deoxychorismate lyase